MFLTFFFKRLITGFITILAVALLSFFIFNMLPGDPALVMLGLDADAGALTALRKELNLEEPGIIRFGRWIADLSSGNLGRSITYRKPVLQVILESLPPTMSIAIVSCVMTLVFSLLLGMLAVKYHNRFADYFLTLGAQLGIVIPSFWMGILLLFVFTLKLEWFPFGQYAPLRAGFFPWFRTIFLPSLSVSFVAVSMMMRMVRTSLLENAREDFVRTAKSKGVPRNKIIYKHILKNAMVPIVTLFGLQVSSILAGTIIIENVFSIPGIGRLLLIAVQRRDLPVVQGIVLWMAAMTVVINVVTDFAHMLLDPRVSL
ncbi:MAG TPA: ABC transporter permease [Thermotogota bacterium]|nr:ABC transporter permease [Thermotogota bacterium]NLZ13200.1 ABC transporter permease [Thermotogaceae bacterium]MDD8041149.1 ABC transporter permease [Thermotogota bacterium]HNR63652.1 ABC transporter permease [Thermotogota bacterium]HNT95910.1 ABC transporter permease [Thermotogota bacterium]